MSGAHAPSRMAVDQTPDPDDIARDAISERPNRMPSIGGTAIDPKKLIGVAAAAGAVMFTVLAVGTGLDGGSKLPPPKPKPALDAPHYDPATVIAPTLAGAATDPNAPVPLAATEVPAIAADPAAPPASPAAHAGQPSPAEALRIAARRSTLIAYGGERAGLAMPGAATNEDGDQNRPIARMPAREATNLETLRRGSAIGQVRVRVMPDRNFLITAGAFIPCVLQTAMDSSQPGFVTCVVPRHVYSDNGRMVLMEKGTRVFGEYQGALNRGQYRLFVLWNRAVTPRGIAIDLASPATDALGRSGAGGRVDTFFWQRFGTALLFSLVEDAATIGAQAVGNRGANTTLVPSDAASAIIQQNADIKPVLRKNQGEDVGITVAQDFDFSGVYGLSLR